MCVPCSRFYVCSTIWDPVYGMLGALVRRFTLLYCFQESPSLPLSGAATKHGGGGPLLDLFDPPQTLLRLHRNRHRFQPGLSYGANFGRDMALPRNAYSTERRHKRVTTGVGGGNENNTLQQHREVAPKTDVSRDRFPTCAGSLSASLGISMLATSCFGREMRRSQAAAVVSRVLRATGPGSRSYG